MVAICSGSTLKCFPTASDPSANTSPIPDRFAIFSSNLKTLSIFPHSIAKPSTSVAVIVFPLLNKSIIRDITELDEIVSIPKSLHI